MKRIVKLANLFFCRIAKLTKLLRDILPSERSVSTKPANVGRYKSGLRDDLSIQEKVRERKLSVVLVQYVTTTCSQGTCCISHLLGRVGAHEHDGLVAAGGLEHPEEHRGPLLQVGGGEHPQPERPHAALHVRAPGAAQPLGVVRERRVQRLGPRQQARHLEAHLHVSLCCLYPRHLDVFSSLDHRVPESDRLVPEGLDLLDRPLDHLLPAEVEPNRPWDRLATTSNINTDVIDTPLS
jgi:hypothetical protein